MPCKAGDIVRVLDTRKNQDHAQLRHRIGHQLVVERVEDRDARLIEDGQGEQSIIFAAFGRIRFHSGRFELVREGPVVAQPLWPDDAPIGWPLAQPVHARNENGRKFHVGQLVETDNFVWKVVANAPRNHIEVEVVEKKGDRFPRGHEIGHRGVHAEGQFRAQAPAMEPIGDIAIINQAIVPPQVPFVARLDAVHEEHEWNVGDHVMLSPDTHLEHDNQGWQDIMDEWAEEKRVFVIKTIIRNSYCYFEEDDEKEFSYDLEWLIPVDRALVAGDVVWYKDHTNEADKQMFIREEKRPKYLVGEVQEDGRLKMYTFEGNQYMATYEADKWVLATEEKEVAKKIIPKIVLDPKVRAEKLAKMLQDCREEFAEDARGVSNFYLICEDKKGELTKIGGTDEPCHYALRGGYDVPHDSVPVAVIDSIHKRRVVLPVYKQQGFIDYVSYLLTRSPWAECYQTNSFEDAETNGILMNLDKTANQLVGACIAMRQASEFNSILPVHAFLKAKRFSGDVCFLVGQHFTMDQRGKFTPINIASGHTILTSTMPAKEVFKFFGTQQFVGEEGNKPYREKLAYTNIFGSITGREEYARPKAGEVSIQTWMHNNCKAEVVGKGLDQKHVVTEASILKLARLVKAELLKHRVKELEEAVA